MTAPLVVALGGHALLHGGATGSQDQQLQRARESLRLLVDAVGPGALRAGLLLVHGNGPQVGNELLRMHHTRDVAPPLDLDGCVASTQGSMGYLLGRAAREVLGEHDPELPVAALVTTVVVDAEAPGAKRLVKPVGPSYSAEEAARLDPSASIIVADGSRGYRRRVPSPRPIEVLELDAIKAMLGRPMVVIAGGGGGVPVARSGAAMEGFEGVIDKDHTAALLATAVGATRLIHLTAVDAVYREYDADVATRLDHLGLDEARALAEDGQFAPGSMGPKMESARDFLAAGGHSVVITSPERLAEALRGEAGTTLVP